MTKKDYELIASIFQAYKEALISCKNNSEIPGDYTKYCAELLTELTIEFAKHLKEDNSNFDADKFIKACTK